MNRFAYLFVALLAGCAALSPNDGGPSDPLQASRAETIVALTDSGDLVRFNAGKPGQIQSRAKLSGLKPDEQLVGIDFRVAYGQLYGLGKSGQLYRLDAATGVASRVGDGIGIPLTGNAFGFDFNPTVDRIRVVSDSGLNLRVHPESGLGVDANAAAPGVQPDTPLAYAAGDKQAGISPKVSAAAYTYNKRDSKLTTNYAIDAALGTLVTQGSKEGVSPVVPPNSGQLFTVGPLGLGPVSEVSFDIADVNNAAFASMKRPTEKHARLYLIDLDTGAAKLIGRIGSGESIRGLAIEP